jgi:hypothetical protein
MGFFKMNTSNRFFRRLLFFIFASLFVLQNSIAASEVELSNLIVRNTQADLLVDLKVKGVFTEDMQDAVERGIPVSFAFILILYKVRNLWLDEKIASIRVSHSIQHDAVKKEYKISLSESKADDIVVKNFAKARQIMSQINGLKIIPLKQLEKGQHYQIRVKSELDDKKFFLPAFPWEFETDWYTINFIY